jgi:hypothetical protein
VKIGSTKDLHERAIGLEKTFGSMLIFQVFPASLFRQFEEFLQTHPSIAKHVFKEVIHDGRASNREVFLMTPNEVADAVALAKRHAAAYNDRATVEQIVEYELTKYKTSILEAQAQGLPLPSPDPYFYFRTTGDLRSHGVQRCNVIRQTARSSSRPTLAVRKRLETPTWPNQTLS